MGHFECGEAAPRSASAGAGAGPHSGPHCAGGENAPSPQVS